jgi:hypothetical protein
VKHAFLGGSREFGITLGTKQQERSRFERGQHLANTEHDPAPPDE